MFESPKMQDLATNNNNSTQNPYLILIKHQQGLCSQHSIHQSSITVHKMPKSYHMESN